MRCFRFCGEGIILFQKVGRGHCQKPALERCGIYGGLEREIVAEVAYRRMLDVRSPLNLHRRRRSPSRASAGSPAVPERWTVASLPLLPPQALVIVHCHSAGRPGAVLSACGPADFG